MCYNKWDIHVEKIYVKNEDFLYSGHIHTKTPQAI